MPFCFWTRKPSRRLLLERIAADLCQLQRQVTLMASTQADLVQAVDDLQVAVKALEDKPDSTPGSGVVDQATLDAAVASIADATQRVNAETVKK